MSRLFISYKRDVEPDERVALQVYQALTSRGHEVFLDQKQIKPGKEWAKVIQEHVQKSDFLVVFLTEKSSASEMVQGEIDIAREQAAVSGGTPAIVPVRIAFAGPLPYPLNAYLDKLQYVMWRSDEDTLPLCLDLEELITGKPVADPQPFQDAVRPAPVQPSYAAALPIQGGPVEVGDEEYVERDSDRLAQVLGRKLGQTIVIKGPRQMGKTSLLVRTLAAAQDAGKRAVWIDFQLLDHQTRQDSTRLYRSFAHTIAEQLLDAPDHVDEHWPAGSSETMNCTRYLQKHVLEKISQPVLIAIDEADTLLGSELGGNFFAMLRAWHDARKVPLSRVWKGVDLVLVISTEPYLLIDKQQSPFNVAATINLCDFSLEETKELNRRHGSPLLPPEVDDLHALLSGHPFLTRTAVAAVSGPQPVKPKRVFEQADDDRGLFGDHLRYYLLRLHRNPVLARAMRQVIESNACDEDLAFRLGGAGLVKREGSKVVPRCKLYQSYFKGRLQGG